MLEGSVIHDYSVTISDGERECVRTVRADTVAHAVIVAVHGMPEGLDARHLTIHTMELVE